MKKNIYTVGWVNTYIKNMFAQDFFLSRICVKGEVSNCKYHSSGHIYFTLKDDQGVLAAVMFAGNRRKGLSFPMKDGDNVVVTGSIGVYEQAGRYQLYAKEIQLDGEGALFQKYEALKKELQEMGMFDECYKQPIPKYIKTLGVVTSRTGAVIQDIQNVSARRNPFVQIVLYPAHVQGEHAAEDIVNGIHALEQYGVDTMIIGRGGGSVEDLWVFNEEIVARAIFECRIPIISAVGHQTNFTIADLVADLRAPTPSAAAELAVFDYTQFRELLLSLRSMLDIRMREHISRSYQYQETLRLKLTNLSPTVQLKLQKQSLKELEIRLREKMRYLLEERRHRLQILAQQLEAGSPARKLSQGFSYVTDENDHPLTQVEQVRPQDPLVIRLLDGRIYAKVTRVEKGYGTTGHE